MYIEHGTTYKPIELKKFSAMFDIISLLFEMSRKVDKKEGKDEDIALCFPKNREELAEIYRRLNVDMSTLQMKPWPGFKSGAVNFKLAMFVSYLELPTPVRLASQVQQDLQARLQPHVELNHTEAKTETESKTQDAVRYVRSEIRQEIDICIDFCKTVADLKYCFSNNRPGIDTSKFDGENWFELAKHDLGLPYSFSSRKMAERVKSQAKLAKSTKSSNTSNTDKSSLATPNLLPVFFGPPAVPTASN